MQQDTDRQHVRRPTLKIATGKLTPTWPMVRWPTNNKNYTISVDRNTLRQTFSLTSNMWNTINYKPAQYQRI